MVPMLRLERSPLEVNRKLAISGVVQGVGFRPFVYQLAARYNLNGSILNNTAGVMIEIEGAQHAIDAFIKALQNELPPLARIDTLLSEDFESVGHTTIHHCYIVSLIPQKYALCFQ